MFSNTKFRNTPPHPPTSKENLFRIKIAITLDRNPNPDPYCNHEH